MPPIILGTMRFGMKGMNRISVAQLITASQNLGCDVLHVSSEYDSHALLVDSLQKLEGTDRKRCRFMVKLASPHFRESTFDAVSLERKIDSYCQELGCESLAMVQWMWRSEDNNDDARCASLIEKSQAIRDCFSSLIKIGKVQAFSCFPYSSKFMRSVRQAGVSATQVNYLNLFETAATDAGIGKSTIVLRPYAGGRVFKSEIKKVVSDLNEQFTTVDFHELPKLSIRFPFLHPDISSVVVSCSRIEEMEVCREIQMATTHDIDQFAAVQRIQQKLISLTTERE